MKIKTIIYHILDTIFLILSYLLCDYLNEKINLLLGLIVGIISYMIINYLLKKILKIKENNNITKNVNTLHMFTFLYFYLLTGSTDILLAISNSSLLDKLSLTT